MVALKEYARGQRIYVQAQQIWTVLGAWVRLTPRPGPDEPALIEYGQLATLMGYEDPRAGHTLGRGLGIVGHFCLENDLPALNVIVVDRRTQQPGFGVVCSDGRSIFEEQMAVMNTDWFMFRPPTTGTLREVWERMSEAA